MIQSQWAVVKVEYLHIVLELILHLSAMNFVVWMGRW